MAMTRSVHNNAPDALAFVHQVESAGGTITVSEAIYHRTKDLFDFELRGGVEVDLMSPEIRLELKDRGVQVSKSRTILRRASRVHSISPASSAQRFISPLTTKAFMVSSPVALAAT
jgi:hypothetical protein